SLGVGGEIENIGVAAGAQDDRVAGMHFDRAGDQIARDDSLRLAVHNYQLEHLLTRKHLYAAERDLALQGLERAQQQLLSGLPAGIEGSRDLHAAEAAILEQATVLAGQWHTPRDPRGNGV